MSFLKKANFTKVETTTENKPKLGGKTLGSLNKSTLGNKTLDATKPSLLKKKAEPKEIALPEEDVKTKEFENMVKLDEKTTSTKPLLGKKSLLSKKKEHVLTEEEIQQAQEDINAESMLGTPVEEIMEIDVTHCSEDNEVIKFEEVAEPKEVELNKPKEKIVEEKKTASKKKTNSKKSVKKKEETKIENKTEQQVLKTLEVDETKRVSLEKMDLIMRPIVAPTTEIWEQEKKDVLEALNAIKVEQDMNMSQVKSCLSDLDELKFEILPKHHDAETMYNGTKQNYDTVKAIAIANGSGGNAEARKAEGILACKNFVTPTGEVVDLHQYMLLIEERQKFYEKISDGVNFKKYSLVNYNNAIKAEKEGK